MGWVIGLRGKTDVSHDASRAGLLWEVLGLGVAGTHVLKAGIGKLRESFCFCFRLCQHYTNVSKAPAERNGGSFYRQQTSYRDISNYL